MKKRSLFAAVAMLIVSAIVLTSATYAWFAASQTNSIQTFGSTTVSGSAGLLLSATGTDNWKATLDFNDYNYQGNTNVLIGSWNAEANNGAGGYESGDDELRPVTGNIDETNGAIAFKAGEMSGTDFTLAAGAASTGYLKYTTYMMPKSSGTITLTPTFTTNRNYVYYAMFVKDGATVMDSTTSGVKATMVRVAAGSATGTNYEAITTTSNGDLTCVDDNGDGIIVAAEKDTNMTLVSQGPVTGFAPFNTGNESITIAVTGNHVYNVVVYCWAEGQDADCISNGLSASTSIGLGVAFAPTT